MDTCAPPDTPPAAFPPHPPVSSAINELEFESPPVKAATAELATPILLIPTTPARNESWGRATTTATKPGLPAEEPAEPLGGKCTGSVAPAGSEPFVHAGSPAKKPFSRA